MFMKIKINYIWYIVFIVFILIFCSKIVIYFAPDYTVTYKGREFTFRENVKDVDEIIIMNNEEYINSLIWNPYIRNIKIIYQANVTNPSYYSVETYELTNKLSAIFAINGKHKNFLSENVESYDDLYSTNELKIVLIHPDLAEESYIKVPRDNIIYVAGKDLRKFDLATMKLILIAMQDYEI